MPRDDINNQLKIQQEINKVLRERELLMKRQATHISAQAQMAKELCNALDCKELDGLEDRLSKIQEGLKAAAEEGSRFGDQAKTAAREVAAQADAADGLNGKLKATRVAALGAGVGFVKGFKNAGMHIQVLGESLKRVARATIAVGKSILAIPFKMLKGLISMSNMFSGQAPVLRQAWEEVRKEFGNFKDTLGTFANKGLGGLKRGIKDVAGSGVRFSRIFGLGQEGAAASVKFLAEYAAGLGPTLETVRGEFAKNADKLTIYIKGLGLTAEAFKGVADYASIAGKTTTSVMKEMTKYSKGFAKRFNMDSKVIAKDMAEMAASMENFGKLSEKELGETAVYARKLGLEIKDLGGIINKFLNFEDAAESASKLQYMFGINIDSMKMMKMAAKGDAAGGINEVKRALDATGKSWDQMNLVEQRKLAELTGMDFNAAAKALSNQATSLDEVRKAGDAVAGSHMSEKDAMKALGKDVEKIIPNATKTFESFSDAVGQGFLRGVMRGKGFRKMLRNVRKSLMVAYYAGIKLGKLFVEKFPGMQQMVKGLTKLFDPKHFKKLTEGLLKVFAKFFSTLHHDPKKGVKGFLAGIKAEFKKFFSEKGDGGSEFIEGFKNMFKAAVGAVLFMIPEMIRGLAAVLVAITEVIAHPPDGPPQGFAQEMAVMIIAAFSDMASAIADSLWPALKGLFAILWEKHRKELMIGMAIFFGYVFGKAIISAILGAVVGGAVITAMGALKNLLMGGVKKLGSAAAEAAKAKDAKGAEKAVKSQKSLIKELAGLGMGEAAKAAMNMVILTAGFIPVLILFAYGLREVASVLAPIDWGDLIKGIIGVATVVPALKMMLNLQTEIAGKHVMSFLKRVPFMIAMLAMLVLLGAALIPVGAIGTQIDFLGLVKFFLGVGAALVASNFVVKATSKMHKATLKSAISKMAMLIPVVIGVLALGLIVAGAVAISNKFNAGMTATLNFFAGIGLTLLSILAIIPLAWAVAAIMKSGVGAFFLIMGILGVGLLFGIMTQVLIPSLAYATKELTNAGGAHSAVQTVEAMTLILSTIASNLGLFMKMGLTMALNWFTGSWSIIKAGVRGVGLLATELVDSLIPGLKKLMKVAGPDPTAFAKVITAVVGFVDAISKIAMIGPNLLKAVSSMKGITPAQISEALKQVGDLTQGIINGMKDLVNVILSGLASMDESDIKKAGAFGKLLGALGSMVQNIAPPSRMMQSIAEENLVGTDYAYKRNIQFQVLMTNFTGFLSGILYVFTEKIGPLLEAILKVKVPGSITTAAMKMDVVVKAMDAVSKFANVSKTFSDIAVQVAGGNAMDLSIASSFSEFSRGFYGFLQIIQESMVKYFGPIVESILAMANKVVKNPKALGQKLDIVGKAMEAMVKFAETVKTLNELAPEVKVKAGAEAARKMKNSDRMKNLTETMVTLEKLMVGEGKNMGIQQIIKKMVKMDIGVKKGNVKTLMNKAKVMVASMEAIGGFAEAIKTMNEVAKDIKVTSKRDVERKLLPKLEAFTAIFASDDKSKPGLAQVMTTLGKALAGVPNVKGIEKRANAIKTIVGALPELMESFQKVSHMVVYDNASKTVGNMASAIYTIMYGTRRSKGLAHLVKRFAKEKSMVNDAVAAEAVMVSARKAIQAAMNIFIILSGSKAVWLQNTDEGDLKLMSGRMEKMRTMLLGDGTTAGILHYMSDISNNQSAKLLDPQALTKIGEFVGKLNKNKVLDKLQTFVKKSKTWDSAVDIAPVTHAMMVAKNILFGGDHTGTKESLSIAGFMKVLFRNGKALLTNTSNMGLVGNILDKTAIAMANLQKIGGVAKNAALIKTQMDGFVAENLSQAITDVVQELSRIDSALADPAVVSFDAIVDSLGEWMTVSQDKIRVDKLDPLQIHLNAKFYIDTEQVATALVDKKQYKLPQNRLVTKQEAGM